MKGNYIHIIDYKVLLCKSKLVEKDILRNWVIILAQYGPNNRSPTTYFRYIWGPTSRRPAAPRS